MTMGFTVEYPVIINAPLREKVKAFYYLDTIWKKKTHFINKIKTFLESFNYMCSTIVNTMGSQSGQSIW